MTDLISASGGTSNGDDEQPASVDPHVGKYYLEMAEGWGAHRQKGWRAWVRRVFRR